MNLCVFGGVSGAGIFTAQYFGQGDGEGVRRTFRYKLWLAVAAVTFLFDSVFIWAVSVPIAFTLSRFTALPVITIYICVQLGDMIKCVIGFVLVKKGVWMQNIVS